MGVRAWFWQAMGGEIDEDGEPTLGIDDWVNVFDGDPRDASRIRQSLGEQDIEAEANADLGGRVGLRRAGPVTAVVRVRAPDAVEARGLIRRLPHLGNRLDRPSPD